MGKKAAFATYSSNILAEYAHRAKNGDVGAQAWLAQHGIGVEDCPPPPEFTIDVVDSLGTRQLHFRGMDALENGVATQQDANVWADIVRQTEAVTMTRLRNGESPVWFHRVKYHFENDKSRDPNQTFANFCAAMHHDKIATGDELSPKKLQIGNSEQEKQVLKTPSDTDLFDLWNLLHTGQGKGKKDTQIADEFSKQNGRKLLNRLKTGRTRGDWSDWKANR